MRATRVGLMVVGLGFGALGAWSIETARAQDAPALPAADEASRLVAQLGAADYEVRERAEKRLVELGDAAVPALRRAAESDDAEVQRRARRALQRIADKGTPHRPDPFQVPRGWQRVPDERPDDPWGGWFGDRDPFADMDEMFRDLFRELGIERPAEPRRGGERDPLGGFGRLLERLREHGGLGPMEPLDPGQFEKEMQRAHERLRELFGGQDPFGGADPFRGLVQPRGGAGTMRSFSMGSDGRTSVTLTEGETRVTVEKAADGAVKVTVTAPDGAGIPSTTEWSAASEAELRERSPEAAGHYDRAMGGMQWRPGGFQFGTPSPRARARTERPRAARGLASAALGLRAEPLSEGLRAQLRLPEGEGVLVAVVEPEGWASRAGLQAWDVIVAVDGTPLPRLQDLEAARRTAADDEHGTLSLTLLRAGERRTITAKAR